MDRQRFENSQIREDQLSSGDLRLNCNRNFEAIVFNAVLYNDWPNVLNHIKFCCLLASFVSFK